MRAAPFLLRQATAAHSPEERAAVWSVVGNLAAAAERLLRLLPKLPRGGIYDMAATLAPGSAFAEGAMLLTAAAAHAAQQLSSDAMQQQRQQRQQLRQQMPPDAAAAAASASLAALAYTLAKRALLWADTPAGRGAEAALALRRSMLPSLDPQLTAAAADRDGRLMAVQLLAELLPGCAYSLGAAGKVEDPQDPMRQYRWAAGFCLDCRGVAPAGLGEPQPCLLGNTCCCRCPSTCNTRVAPPVPPLHGTQQDLAAGPRDGHRSRGPGGHHPGCRGGGCPCATGCGRCCPGPLVPHRTPRPQRPSRAG